LFVGHVPTGFQQQQQADKQASKQAVSEGRKEGSFALLLRQLLSTGN
jgi:hypothetical protein